MKHNYIREALTEYYGERCPEFAEGCACCESWAQYDRLIWALVILVDLNDNYSPFGGEIFRDRIDRVWDNARSVLEQEQNDNASSL